MKTKLSFLIPVVIIIAAACNKENIASNTPACVRQEIKNNGDNNDWAIGRVDEYFFQNKLVYAFEPDGTITADAPTAIKDASCNTICNVGGFGGPNVVLCNGENFSQNAVYKRNIWKK